MKALRWTIINGAVLAITLAAAHTGNPGLVRVACVLLISWSVFSFAVFGLVVLVYSASSAAMLPTNLPKESIKSPVPETVSHVFDLIVVCVCAYSGWVATAVFYLMHIPAQALSIALLQKLYEKQKNVEQAAASTKLHKLP
jgi:hypothetical protein